MLPVEDYDSRDVAVARDLMIASMVLTALLVLAVLTRRFAYAAASLMMILAAFELTRVGVVPASEYDLARRPDQFSLHLHKPFRINTVQFGDEAQAWLNPPLWHRFDVTLGSAKHQHRSEVIPANQVITASCGTGVASITVKPVAGTAIPGSIDLPAEANSRFVVYRSHSLLRRWTARFNSHC